MVPSYYHLLKYILRGPPVTLKIYIGYDDSSCVLLLLLLLLLLL